MYIFCNYLRRAAVQHVRSSNQLRVAFIHNTKTPGIITKVRRILKSHSKLYSCVSDPCSLNPNPEPDILFNPELVPDKNFYDKIIKNTIKDFSYQNPTKDVQEPQTLNFLETVLACLDLDTVRIPSRENMYFVADPVESG